MTQTKTEKKPAAKKPTTPAASKAETKPAPAAKKPKAKVERTTKYLPTQIALVLEKGKPSIVVGSRRIAATKGEVVDKGAVFWSQLKYQRIGKSKTGAFRLTTERAAAAKGLEIL